MMQVLNLFLALLLSSFGAESLKHSEEEEGPNKLQEAIDRINRFIIYSKSHILYCIKVYVQRKPIVPPDYDDPDAAALAYFGVSRPAGVVVGGGHGRNVGNNSSAAGRGTCSNGHVHEVEMNPGGHDGPLTQESPEHHQTNGKCFYIVMGSEGLVFEAASRPGFFFGFSVNSKRECVASQKLFSSVF